MCPPDPSCVPLPLIEGADFEPHIRLQENKSQGVFTIPGLDPEQPGRPVNELLRQDSSSKGRIIDFRFLCSMLSRNSMAAVRRSARVPLSAW